MKVVAPSYAILDHLDEAALAVRIEYCGRICYKSEDRITPESAVPFVRRMIEHGHNSVLEMGVCSVLVEGAGKDQVAGLYRCLPRYLVIDELEEGLLVTGSVRAFREMYLFHPGCEIIAAVTAALAERHPYFFEDLLPDHPISPAPGLRVAKMRLDQVALLPTHLLQRHRHLAVQFVVNRAVSHEIVRHRPCAFLQESQRYCRYDRRRFGGEVTFIRPLFFPEGSPEYDIWRAQMEASEQAYLALLETASPQAARTVLPNSCKTELIVYANLTQWQHIFRLRTSPAAEPSMREVMVPLAQDFAKRFPRVFSEVVD